MEQAWYVNTSKFAYHIYTTVVCFIIGCTGTHNMNVKKEKKTVRHF